MGKYAIEISNQTVNLVSHDIVGANPTFPTNGSIVQYGLGLRIVNPATWVQIPLEPPMLTVAQLVEHQFVELDVASSSLVRQPKNLKEMYYGYNEKTTN